MSVDACAALVERGDPDRYAALLAAPPAARPVLAVLYAFNLEVARAPWVSKEPMIGEMRLQFWRDVVADAPEGRIRAHEVAGPLAELIRDRRLPVDLLDGIVAARRHDLYPEPFEDQAAFDAYLEDTAAGLMWASALALGATPGAEPTVRAWGWAAGLVAYLRAVPDLEERGRLPLVDGRAEALAELARRALERLGRAGRVTGPAAAALLPAWQARALLSQITAEPQRVAEGAVGLSDFGRRWRLAKAAFFGL